MARDPREAAVEAGGMSFSFLITTILLAFLVGVPLGTAARRMHHTMFNPDIEVSPENQTNRENPQSTEGFQGNLISRD